MSETQPGIQLAQLIAIIERLYPPAIAESWDSVGLIAGDPKQQISKVLLAVDPVASVVDQAIAEGVDLVITHHPLFLKPVHSVAANSFKGDIVHRLTRHGIALYNAHTNADSAPRGVADALAAAIGVEHRAPLVLAPPSALSNSSLPDDAAVGIGRVGYLAAPMKLSAFAHQVAQALPSTAQLIRVSGPTSALVQKVAVVGGAGDSLFDAVRSHDADVYVTADLRHHPASEARERALFDTRATQGDQAPLSSAGTPYLVDVPHFASEWPWLNYAAADIKAACQAELGDAAADCLEFIVSERNTDPWTATIGPYGPLWPAE